MLPVLAGLCGEARLVFDFDERLAFSKGVRQRTDAETIRAMIDGCERVDVASTEHDRRGIDYFARLHGGVQIHIDAKARDRGCSQFWKQGIPELALEDWSVVPVNGHSGKIGWTLDVSKETDMVLFTFDPADTDRCYLISFQLLRIAFRRYCSRWLQQYKHAPQQNNGWKSHCVFVPVRVVFKAILDVSCSHTVQARASQAA